MPEIETARQPARQNGAPAKAAGTAEPLMLAFANNKGGVGKTTTAVSVAAALSVRGRVLLLDLDDQGSSALSLGLASRDRGRTLMEVLTDQVPLWRIIRPTPIADLDLAIRGPDSADELLLAYQRQPMGRLRQALDDVRGHYDYVVLDCPPSMSVITRNALVAADGFVIPLAPHYLALQGLYSLARHIDEMRHQGLDVGRCLGILLTMVDYRTRHTAQTAEQVRREFGRIVFGTEIPVNIRLAEAPAQGQSIFQHHLRSRGARQYWVFTKELLARAQSLQRPALATSGDGMR